MVSVQASLYAPSTIHIVVRWHARHLSHFSEILYGMGYTFNLISILWVGSDPGHLGPHSTDESWNICCLGPVEAAPSLNSHSNAFPKIHVYGKHASLCALSKNTVWYGLHVQPHPHSLSWFWPRFTLGPTPLMYLWQYFWRIGDLLSIEGGYISAIAMAGRAYLNATIWG